MSDTKHMSDDDLLAQLSLCPQVGTYYQHYKTGTIYLVIGQTIHEETLEPMVLYLNVSSPYKERPSFARPLREWREVMRTDGDSPVRRFQPIR